MVVCTKTHIRIGTRIRADKEYGFRLEGFGTPAEDPCRKKSHRQVDLQLRAQEQDSLETQLWEPSSISSGTS